MNANTATDITARRANAIAFMTTEEADTYLAECHAHDAAVEASMTPAPAAPEFGTNDENVAIAELLLGTLPANTWGRIWIQGDEIKAVGALTFAEARELRSYQSSKGLVGKNFRVIR